MTIYEMNNGSNVDYTLTDFDCIHQAKVTPNIVDALCIETVVDPSTNSKTTFFQQDVSLLFNQQRLNDVLGVDGVRKFFDSFAQRSSSLTQLRSKISDSDLAKLCKSRYLQAPSEILAWSQYLNDNYKSLLSEVSASKEVPSPDAPSSSNDVPLSESVESV